MVYRLGRGSKRELRGVHPDLVEVVKKAILITKQDFTVHDGMRTVAEQRENIARGVSRTMKSKHLPQADGWSHAVDLVPYINGRLRWEWNAIYPIAGAMRSAAREKGVAVRWGGSWERLDNDNRDPEVMVQEYVDMRRSRGLKAFIDGPHYELII